MCDDHAAASPAEDERPGISRRAVLSGAVAAGVAATGALAGCTSSSEPPRRSPRDTAADGLTAYSMATHVHSSFSEMNGSMDSQLFQATKNSVDVLWWTEHDQRMLAGAAGDAEGAGGGRARRDRPGQDGPPGDPRPLVLRWAHYRMVIAHWPRPASP